MRSLTFGDLPSDDDLSDAFYRACPTGLFRFGNDPRVGTDELGFGELLAELKKATDEFNEDAWSDSGVEAGLWASNVLSVLGFEWI